MLSFSSVFIICCKLLTVLMCLVIDVSRLDSDRMSDLIEIKNALLDPVDNKRNVAIVGPCATEYIS